MKIVFSTYYSRRFTQGECCTSIYRRGRYYVAPSFEQAVNEGVSGPRHMSVGRFLPKDTHWIKPTSLCVIPWTYIECETGSLLDNFHATKTTIEVLSYYFDLRGAHVVFSGNKSFWIALPSYLLGNPIGSVENQKAIRQRVFLPLMEYPVDEHLWDARHLRRVVGSQHERGGRVRAVSLESLFDGSWKRGSLDLPDPFAGEPCETLKRRVFVKTRFHVPPFDEIPRSLEGGTTLSETEDGSEEGNRNYTAYRRACALMRKMSEEDVYQELRVWNRRNSPPLNEHELRGCVRSAFRTLERHSQAA